LLPPEDSETPNGVCKIEGRTVFVTPIESQCLVVTTLRQIRASLFMVDIAQMPDRVRQHERLVKLAIQRHGFLITLSGRGTVPPSRQFTTSPEFLRPGKPVRAIRVRFHVHLGRAIKRRGCRNVG
jgi:hypothetical protein